MCRSASEFDQEQSLQRHLIKGFNHFVPFVIQSLDLFQTPHLIN
jgi:hypothetical protein